MAALHLQHLKKLGGLRQSVPTPVLPAELQHSSMPDILLLKAARFWNSLATSSGLHHRVVLFAALLTAWGLRSGYVAGSMTALRDVGYDTAFFTAGSLPEVDITQLRHNLRTHRDAVWQQLHVSPCSAPSADTRLFPCDRWFRPFNLQSSTLRLPVSHTAMRQLLSFRTGCHGLPIDLGRGSGVARADRACMLCRRCITRAAVCYAGAALVMSCILCCAALQGLTDDMPSLLQDVHSMQCSMWQENMVLTSNFVQGGVRMVRAARSGDELDI